MVPLDAFMSRLMPSAPGAPDPLVRQALVDAAIQFCELTGIARFTSDPVPTVAGVSTYDVDLPEQTEMSKVIGLWVGGHKINTAPEVTVQDHRGVYQQETPDTGFPGYAVVIEPRAVTFVPAPNTDNLPILIRSTTRPTRSATKLDDVLFDRWAESIVAGALYRLCNTPGQPYTDVVRAQQSRAEFYGDMSLAKIDANRGGVVGSISVRARPFM